MSWDAWQVGVEDARAGKPATACPYPAESYELVTWYHGYAWAIHMDATKRQREVDDARRRPRARVRLQE